jgi:hypothetical protein
MTPNQLAQALKAEIVDANVAIYRDLYRTANRGDAIDPYWAKAFATFDRMEADDKDVLLEIMRQVAVDTVSNVLGVLDGSSSLPGVEEDFHLATKRDSSARLNDGLQDAFLELVEAEQNDTHTGASGGE